VVDVIGVGVAGAGVQQDAQTVTIGYLICAQNCWRFPMANMTTLSIRSDSAGS
jgi:hypothetical protein